MKGPISTIGHPDGRDLRLNAPALLLSLSTPSGSLADSPRLAYVMLYVLTDASIVCDSQSAAVLVCNTFISIVGTIELFQGKPEIKVTAMDQIKGTEPQRMQ